MFNKKQILNAGLASELTKLKKKHQGGLNQRKGSRYEDYFSLFKIVKNIDLLLDNNSQKIEIKDQVANCFIDDLLVKKDGARVDFYQCKDVKKLSWSSALLEDFENQVILNKSQGLNYSLTLVVSNPELFDKMSYHSSNIIENTYIKYFPSPINIEDLIKNNHDFNKFIKGISAIRNPSLMDLDSLAKRILSEWVSFSYKMGFVNLDTLIKNSSKDSTPIKSNWVSNSKWKKAEKILKGIPKLEYYTDRGIFEFSAGCIYEGFVQANQNSIKFDRFLNRIIKHKPKNIIEFEELLP